MSKKSMEETKKLMGALVKMKPKPHQELKRKKATVAKDHRTSKKS